MPSNRSSFSQLPDLDKSKSIRTFCSISIWVSASVCHESRPSKGRRETCNLLSVTCQFTLQLFGSVGCVLAKMTHVHLSVLFMSWTLSDIIPIRSVALILSINSDWNGKTITACLSFLREHSTYVYIYKYTQYMQAVMEQKPVFGVSDLQPGIRSEPMQTREGNMQGPHRKSGESNPGLFTVRRWRWTTKVTVAPQHYYITWIRTLICVSERL